MDSAASLSEFLRGSRRLVVLTGAGCSTQSGIPDYRDERGAWKRPAPLTLQELLASHAVRQRYWARSLRGYAYLQQLAPNPAHYALAALERLGRVTTLVTQNVDGLHQRAGSERVIDLHGRLDAIECVGCRQAWQRDDFQRQLEADNPCYAALRGAAAPDGDMDLAGVDYAGFNVPSCGACGGLLKPQVVFFGETVPAARVAQAYAAVDAADAVLIVGTSLMVFSGYRFARRAAARGLPIAVVNQGQTRADGFAQLKLDGEVGALLTQAVGALTALGAEGELVDARGYERQDPRPL